MSKHNYTALTTFRGWRETEECWVYGDLFGKERILTDNREGLAPLVYPDSIGVYTGKDDKDGKPIFCGVGAAKYGGDNVALYNWDTIGDRIIRYVEFNDGSFMVTDTDKSGTCSIQMVGTGDCKITSTQWEEHLKAEQ